MQISVYRDLQKCCLDLSHQSNCKQWVVHKRGSLGLDIHWLHRNSLEILAVAQTKIASQGTREHEMNGALVISVSDATSVNALQSNCTISRACLCFAGLIWPEFCVQLNNSLGTWIVTEKLLSWSVACRNKTVLISVAALYGLFFYKCLL